MAGSATVYTERGVLGHTLAITAMPQTTGAYLGLCLVTPIPTRSVGGTEVAGGGYTRVLATFALSANPDNMAANAATLEFPVATANWGSIGYFEVWTAATGGTRLYWGPLVDPVDGLTPVARAVNSGDIVRLPAGSVQVQAT
jgi:hypothetical protein